MAEPSLFHSRDRWCNHYRQEHGLAANLHPRQHSILESRPHVLDGNTLDGIAWTTRPRRQRIKTAEKTAIKPCQPPQSTVPAVECTSMRASTSSISRATMSFTGSRSKEQEPFWFQTVPRKAQPCLISPILDGSDATHS